MISPLIRDLLRLNNKTIQLRIHSPFGKMTDWNSSIIKINPYVRSLYNIENGIVDNEEILCSGYGNTMESALSNLEKQLLKLK